MSLGSDGAHARANINFARAGAKWMVAAYVNLEAL